MRVHFALAVLGLALVHAPCTLRAQSAGAFAGLVERDTLGNPVARAEVRLAELNRIALTNVVGRFQFTDLPPGRYTLTVRAVGFEPLLDTVDIQAGARLDAEIVMTEQPVQLEASRTSASQDAVRYPELLEMAARRKAGLGGYFITDSLLRAHDSERLSVLLASIPGLKRVSGTMSPTAVYISGGRSIGKDRGGRSFPVGQCYVTVYIDGRPFFVGPASDNPPNPPPDATQWWARDFAGIEYYPGGASVPAEFNATATDCGTLLLWTRH